MGKSHDLATLTDDSVTFDAGGTFTAVKAASTQYTDFELLDTTNNYAWIMSNRGTSPASFEILTRDASNTYTQPLKIDASGRVTMPYQPYARASSSTTTSATQRIPLNSHNAYRGGMSIDNTNNRINVPVSGAYVIGYSHLGNSGSGNTQIEIRINGTSEHGTRIQTTGSNNDNGSTQWIKELSANDYIEFWCIQGAAHGNSSYNSMWAYLIG